MWANCARRELPYLNAAVQEGLRLYGAGSGVLPRSEPAGGKVLGTHALPGALSSIRKRTRCIGSRAYSRMQKGERTIPGGRQC